MTINDAEDIFMAWQSGMNYPKHLLGEAILTLTPKENEECITTSETRDTRNQTQKENQ